VGTIGSIACMDSNFTDYWLETVLQAFEGAVYPVLPGFEEENEILGLVRGNSLSFIDCLHKAVEVVTESITVLVKGNVEVSGFGGWSKEAAKALVDILEGCVGVFLLKCGKLNEQFGDFPIVVGLLAVEVLLKVFEIAKGEGS
jgi:hypothetical protein